MKNTVIGGTIPPKMNAVIDRLVAAGLYKDRADAVRTALRNEIGKHLRGVTHA